MGICRRCLDLDADNAEETAYAIRALGRNAISVQGGVTNKESVSEAINRTVQELGELDVALNNAGVAHQAPAEELDLAYWKRMIDINLTSVGGDWNATPHWV